MAPFGHMAWTGLAAIVLWQEWERRNGFAITAKVVGVLAIASAARYYLVMTIGERIVAVLRRDVFGHLLSLSPAFFVSARLRHSSP